jgi:hypothetical protein
MADKDWVNTTGNRLGVETRIWGASGRSVCERIEGQLGVILGDELTEFAETVGNASVGPFMIAVGGNEQGQMSAVAETNSARMVNNDLPRSYVKVMEHAGESYFYDSQSHEVHAFDSLNIDPAMKTLSFSGFNKFLEWAFTEAKLQSEDQ